jgi:pimeloyl-ACP methyl ester carboxylesterase
MTNQNKELDNLHSAYYQGLHISLVGDGEAVVFLHGGPGSEHRFFLPHVLPLSQKYKLIFYDQRGCGKSEPPKNNQYSMKEEVNALELLQNDELIDYGGLINKFTDHSVTINDYHFLRENCEFRVR